MPGTQTEAAGLLDAYLERTDHVRDLPRAGGDG